MCLRHGFAGLVLTVFSLHPVWADDTEIFFNNVSNTGAQPNLLFVLDASNSMQRFDCAVGGSQTNSCNDGTPSGTTSRLDRMNAALKSVLDLSSGVNVGLMRFGGTRGGRVIYPMRDIDAPVCSTAECLQNHVFTEHASVRSSDSDAVENSNGNVVTNAVSIPLMGEDNGNIVAIRFPGLRIPQGAVIEDARIFFHSDTESNESRVSFQVEDVVDAAPFTDAQKSISNRQWAPSQLNWDTVGPWEQDRTYESPNLAHLVSHVVRKADWCGGNALAFKLEGSGNRSVVAFDADSVNRLAITVQFKIPDIANNSGCTLNNLHAQIGESAGDAFETNGNINNTNTGIFMTNTRLHALQFKDLALPKGAKVREAYLQLYSISDTSGPIVIDTSVESTGDSAELTAQNNNISSRTKNSAAQWSIPDVQRNTWYRTPDLSAAVGNVLGKADWELGNNMTFFMQQVSGGRNTFAAFNRSSELAPRLVVSYEANGVHVTETVINSVRDEMKRALDDIRLSWGTPTVGAMEEGLRYYSGDSVHFGKRRAMYYDPKRPLDALDSRVSHPDSYTGGSVSRHPACTDSNLNEPDCITEQIIGSAVYESPIQMECQSNHMIVLSDGGPFVGNSDDGNLDFIHNDHDNLQTRISSLSGDQCIDSIAHGECGEDLAEYMNREGTDINPLVPGDQTITTYTIGFNVRNDWLEDVGNAGGGGYFTADSADELASVVTTIVGQALDVDSTFVAPAVTVDQFSRLSHREDVYLSLFSPSVTASWTGNLKGYFLGEGGLLDADRNPAVDAETGSLLATARSAWSIAGSPADGNDTEVGGAAALLDPNDRNIVTYLGGDDVNLFSEENRISADNSLLDDSELVNGEEDLATYVDWLAGFDVKDEDDDGVFNDPRHHIGDALHSQPTVITYAGSSTADSTPSVVFVGTNEGFLHAFNTGDGQEEFAFMPEELFSNVPILFNNKAAINSETKPYGLDGDITVRTIDKNRNGVVDTDDEAHIYVGMRRGGRSYYALDVSDVENPKFKWQILGGNGEFSELGQSWSKLTLAKIRVGDTVETVLVFGGGYDPAQDNNTIRTEDNIGRAIYIVNADTGKLIWSGGPTDAQATTTFEEMQYSIPSDVRIVSSEDDGLLSQIYVGDMGGRIWRFDINNGQEGSNLVEGGVIADFGVDDDPVGARRFYYPPDLSFTRVQGERLLNVGIGSGYRAHPLDGTIEDKFFMIRYPFNNEAPREYGYKTPNTLTYNPITLTELFDTTDNVISNGTEEEISDARDELARQQGWFISMEATGEKILGSSSTLNNIVRFVSYVPALAESNGCAPNLGKSFFWALNLADGTPFSSFGSSDESNDTLSRSDRRHELPGNGIAPPVQTVFVPTKDKEIVITDMVGVNRVQEWENLDLLRRTYWSERPY